ncbi:hypothetical protein CWATWH0003_1170 [Crocosphaera watsonii WH 0003]|uniref:Uncharacterized protein n=1 Tax=Crocosphaera watsonii WH 0003 TaxID=423471 RepID=G5J0Y0_CROWT|nr:hypothetical protein CWATWH0003_1170 [Crocosphaera watsonii WH 0003]
MGSGEWSVGSGGVWGDGLTSQKLLIQRLVLRLQFGQCRYY